MSVLHVIGAGVSGICFSKYVIDHNKDAEIYLYERKVSKIGCNCAWATHEKFKRLVKDSFGINLDDYVLFKPVGLHVHSLRHPRRDFYIEAGSLYIIDKRRLLRDMLNSCIASGRLRLIELEISSFESMSSAAGVSVNAEDVLVCTGTFAPVYRSEEGCIPCYQMRVTGRLNHTHCDGYLEIMIGKLGYGWAFPLNRECTDWHVGAGDFFISPEKLTDVLINRIFLDYRKVCQCGSTYVRVVPPFASKVVLPVKSMYGMSVNVSACGELSGNVTALIGEGIYPSAVAGIECAKRYLDTGKLDTDNLSVQADKREIAFIEHVLKHGKVGVSQISNIFRIYRNARSMGLKVNLMTAFRMLRAWR